MKKITLLLAVLTCSFAMAQGLSVKGNVLDGTSDNAPIAFASVKVKDLNINTETDMDGNYELSLLDGDYILIVEFIGYEPITLENVIVDNEMILLDPVVLMAKRPSYDLATIEE